MKLAILTAGSSTHTKGLMNFVCEEARQMYKRQNKNFSCDVFMIREKRTKGLENLICLLRKGKKTIPAPDEGKPSFEMDGVTFHNIWIKEGIISFLVRSQMYHKPISRNNCNKVIETLKGYDYIIAHNTISQYSCYKLKEFLGIPFGAFWHGSELTTSTFLNRNTYKITKDILENANDNFFVSKSLQNIARSITCPTNPQVIYTGPSEGFYKYSEKRKNELRKQFGVLEDDIVVAYAGNLVPIKNVLVLPAIFKKIKEKCREKNFKFWIIGNGELENELRLLLEQSNIDFVMHGKVLPSRMPDYMNCIDILLLISKKEGLGLVCLEAMKCGANVFGSKVGGIPEVVGEDHCAPLDEFFVPNLSKLIINSIRNNEEKGYSEDVFSWKSAIDTILAKINV